MNQSLVETSSSLSPGARIGVATLGTILIVLLGIASRLDPNPAGLGTHRQLGLLPCTFQWIFNRPCPTCGMTTSWSHVMRGQLGPALRANVGGTLLAILSLAAGPWLLISAARGRWLGLVPNERLVAAVMVALALITLVDWIPRVW